MQNQLGIGTRQETMAPTTAHFALQRKIIAKRLHGSYVRVGVIEVVATGIAPAAVP